MISISHKETVSSGDGTTHMPFEELTGMLQQEGFSIKPDDYIEILKIVENYGGGEITGLKFRLAPLICNNETEQHKFYRLFDEYARITKEKDTEQKKRKSKKAILLASIIIASLVILSVVYVNYKPLVPGPPPASFAVLINGQGDLKENVAALGDTVTLDASPVFAVKNYDSTDLRLAWDTGKGWERFDARSISFPVTSTGERKVKLRVQSIKHPDYLSEDSQYITFCSGMISSLQVNEEMPFYPGDNISLQPVIRGNSDFIKNPVWVVNDQDTLRNKGQSLSYRFDTAGSYTIKFFPEGERFATACAREHSVFFQVNKKVEGLRLTANALGSIPEPLTTLNAWLWMLLLLPIAGMLITKLLHERAKRKWSEKLKSVTNTERGPVQASLSPPFDVPFQNRDIELINREPEMNLLFRAMRNKTEDECRVLHISKSIQSEIRSGGVPSLVFTNRMKQQEYLILIDKSIAHSQQVHLFDYLSRLLCEENINIERFYYQDFSAFYNHQFPSGISFKRLAEIYKTDVLIIFGDAHQLIYPAWPAIKKEESALLNEWEFKAILTPKAYHDWAVNENALKREIVVLPADIKGQVQLLQAIKEKQLKQDKYLASFQEFYETASYYFTDVEEIKNYLDDPTLFQWLCAICVYPKIRWEIIVEVGKKVCKQAGEESKLNFSNLLKLVRIPWMQEGIIPQRTRLELLKELTTSNEVTARETVLNMLASPELYYKGNHFFLEEKEQQEITNKFVLFAHDNNKYPEFEKASAEFQAKWEQNRIHDNALRRYLDKQHGDNWETPLKDKNSSATGLDAVFNSKSKQGVNKPASKFNIAYIAALAVLLIMLAFLFFGKSALDGKAFAGIPLTTTDTARIYQLSFNLTTDTCITDPAAFTEGISGKLKINETDYPLSFASWNSATAPVPYYDARSEKGVLELSLDDGTKTISQVVTLASSTSVGLENCHDPMKPALSIRYNNPAANDSLDLLIQMISNEFKITDQQPDSSATSRVIYYRNIDKPRADSIAYLVTTVLDRKIPVEYIPVKSTTALDPVLYVNFPAPEVWTSFPLLSLPASLNEIWKGNSNNRLMTIDLVDRLIWYSTGVKTSYGTYRILEASRKGSIIKLIATANRAYAVFYLQNISSTGFQVCFQPVFLKTKEEADKHEFADCRNTLDNMRLYYPPLSERSAAVKDKANVNQAETVQRFYYPLLFVQQFNPAETRLLQSFLKQQASAEYEDLKANFKFNRFWNNLKLVERKSSIESVAASDARLNYLNRIASPIPVERTLSRMPNPDGTPFDRDYVDITITRKKAAEPADPCRITYRNINEALKSGNACRLDLSDGKLQELPAGLGNLTSLQFLDIRNNYLAADDSISLRRMLPKCQILFSPQLRRIEPVNWIYLQRIELEKSTPASRHRSYIQNLSNQLEGVPAARIKIVAYYQSVRDSKDADRIAQDVKSYILRMAKLSSDQVITETMQSGEQQQKQQQQQQSNANNSALFNRNEFVDLYGMNLPVNKK